MSRAEIASQNVMNAKMDSGGLDVGMIVRLMRGVEVAAIANSAGFDCLYIDLGYCSFSPETASQISLTATALGVTPMVRAPCLNPAEISRTLETGALGIIVPHLENRAQAEEVVQAAKFPPISDRPHLAVNPHTPFLPGSAAGVMRGMNVATLVVGMIESLTAVGHAADIASVAGLDGLSVETNDLCNSLGVPGEVEHPRVREACNHVAAACRAKGKHLGVGGLNSRPELAKEMIRLGARYVSAGSDTGFLMNAATAVARPFS